MASDYVRVLSNPDVGDVHVLFANALRAASELERLNPGQATATRRLLLRSYNQLNRELDALAATTAAQATKRIQERLKATAKRKDTGVRPHLRNGIVSRPLHRFGALGTGEVGIADVGSLDKVISNTSPGYGPYWRAQEYGTGGGDAKSTKSQKGRVLRGYFFDPGLKNPTVPMKGRSDQPIFVPGRPAGLPSSVKGGIGPKGGKGGRGVIGKEIAPRHFIRDGTNLARGPWLRGIRAIERDTMKSLDAVTAGPRPRTLAGRRARAQPRGRRR